MKKRIFVTAGALLGVGGLVAVMSYHPSTQATSTAVTPQPSSEREDRPSTEPASEATPTPTPVPATPAPTPTPTAVGRYRNGTYTGQTYNIGYGLVQVQAVVSGGRLANVRLLQMPENELKSRQIASWAGPQLVQEAITAQSAQVDIVSGATQDSEGFIASLGSALKQAS
jgi:uncharacterized protein with FMN-binding domain